MKKLIFSMLFLALVTIFSAKANASCPIGYTADTAYFSQGLCEIEVHFCYLLSPSGHQSVYIDFIKLPDPEDCTGLLINNAFWTDAYDAIFDTLHTIVIYPPCTALDHNEVNFVFEKATCWRIVDDYTLMMSLLEPCDEEAGSCKTEYRICWENGNLIRTKFDSVLLDDGECDELQVWEVYHDPNPNPFELIGNKIYHDCFNSCW